jgi:[FeFe] hydrogenase H-cluster maturation GTPase HydF
MHLDSMMQTTPKSLRLQVAFMGLANAGKSSVLNAIAGQDVAIVSALPGTTTDVVEKPIELPPLGPVLLLDTAGLNDTSELGALRIARAHRVLDRADVIVLVTGASELSPVEKDLVAQARHRHVPVAAIVNKTDLAAPTEAHLAALRAECDAVLTCRATDPTDREALLVSFTSTLIAICPESFTAPPPLIGDLVPPGGLVALVVPIDLQAPRGRLILPQVQTLRDILDHDGAALVVKEREYRHLLDGLGMRPALAVCDSQAVLKTVADTPDDIPCTTFSILQARQKGDLQAFAAGAASIRRLRDGDRVLISESCTHHSLEDDIGRVKIPRWLRQFTGAALEIEHVAGADFPPDVGSYRLIVQCGGCMQNRREMLSRVAKAQSAGVAMTNYGLCIAETLGVLMRVLGPFPAALRAYEAQAGGERPSAPSRKGADDTLPLAVREEPQRPKACG